LYSDTPWLYADVGFRQYGSVFQSRHIFPSQNHHRPNVLSEWLSADYHRDYKKEIKGFRKTSFPSEVGRHLTPQFGFPLDDGITPLMRL
jgi:hypothetical protein